MTEEQSLEQGSPGRELLSTASFLAQTRLFGTLPLNELMILAANVGLYSCPDGHIIFRRDDPGDVLYIIKSGSVRIVLPVRGGRDTTLAVLNSGDLFGELSILDGRPRTATAQATAPTEALTIHRENFFIFLRRQPEAAIRILGVLASRLRRTDELLGEALFQDVPSRLAKRLLDLADAGSVHTEAGVEIVEQVTLRDMASLLGTTASTLQRYLRVLQAKGLVHFSRGKVVLLEPDALRRLAEE